MELTRVNVKWEDGIWYPAMILRQINEKEVEVEFEDPDCPLEIVLISDTKPIEGGTFVPSINPITGTYFWNLFKRFCRSILGNHGDLVPLTAKKLLELNLKSLIFTDHANERKDQRYGSNSREFFRSINSNEFLAFRQTRTRVFCGRSEIECTSDLTNIFSYRINSSKADKKFRKLRPRDINALRDASKQWDHLNDLESSTRSNVVRIIVITANTKFVLNEDCSTVITIIKHEKNFDQWLTPILKRRKLTKTSSMVEIF